MVIEERSEPDIQAGWVLISVDKVGICGSDISGYLGHNELRKPPLVMGHEFSGTIVKVGSGVSSDWKNRLVTVNPILTCGDCRLCRQGDRQICAKRKIIGIDYPGAFADFVAAPIASCYPTKNAVAGALVEPLACGVRATKLSGAGPGDTVLVIGAGTIGLMIIRMLKARGVHDCVVVDTNETRLGWALNWGASNIVNPRKDDLTAFVKSITSGDGMDSVIDAVGLGETRAQSVSFLRRGGRAVWIGLHENTSSLLGNEIVRFEKEIVGSFSYSDDDFRRAVSLVNRDFVETKSGWLDTRSLNSGQTSFMEQTSESARYSKILLDPKI